MSSITASRYCPACGTEVARGLLSCPTCQQLIHAETLKQLAAQAEAAEQQHDLSGAMRAWREALELLPSESRQYEIIHAKVEGLSRQVDAGTFGGMLGGNAAPAAADGTHGPGGNVPAGQTDLGMLLLGLTKGVTVISMAISFLVYRSWWGWKFALGMTISIYIHEMGHMTTAVRYGIKTSPPIFIPGFGALISLRQPIDSPREEARLGLAGPWWGLFTAIGAYAVFMATGWQEWGAIAKVGALINLFNLVPVWQLDGARGFRGMAREQRGLAVLVIAVAWYLTGERLLVLLFLVAASRAMFGKADEHGDWPAAVQYAILVGALATLAAIPVHVGWL